MRLLNYVLKRGWMKDKVNSTNYLIQAQEVPEAMASLEASIREKYKGRIIADFGDHIIVEEEWGVSIIQERDRQ